MHGASRKTVIIYICFRDSVTHPLLICGESVRLAGWLSAKCDSIIMGAHTSNPPTWGLDAKCSQSKLLNLVLLAVTLDMIISGNV